MGGNVFPVGTTKIFLADEYHKLSSEIMEMFLCDSLSYTLISRIDVIESYSEKESFGDCDVLYSTFNGEPIDIQVFGEVFSTKNVSRNSEVISIEYKMMQVDFIHISNMHYDYGLSYFGFCDCGNLIGKLAHQLGLKHGHKGLVLPLRDGFNKFHDVVLTLDHNKTLELLDLDVEKFNSGFANLDEIFNFISASKYYSPENYKLENLNSIAKIRDRKRDTYNKFLAFGESFTGNVYKRSKDKSVHLENIFDFFPNAYSDYKSAIEKLAMQQLCKTKFNGDIVSELTGMSGRELGNLMKILRDDWYFRSENIVYLTEEQIQSKILHKLCFMMYDC